jgi:AraC-like DNA-binding protein
VDKRERIVHRSKRVTLSEICIPPATAAQPRLLMPGTIVFVRSGLFGMCDAHSSILFDANYCCLAVEGDRLFVLQTSKEPCACTLLYYHDAAAFGRGVPLNDRCVLSTPGNHLTHARILNDAWLGKAADAIDRAADALLQETLANTQTAKPPSYEHRYTVQAIKELLNRSLSKPPSLAEVAGQFYLSPFTVSRIFHRGTGISLRRYTHRLRLRKALSMMLSGSFALTDIAVELGFYDEPHFSKAFNAEFGSAPAFALRPSCNRGKEHEAKSS